MLEIPPSLRAALAERYPLERVLGQGGMATVYLARDLRHDRPVAVKVLRPEVAVLLGRERFEREIRRTASLNHPNIIPVYDSGEVAGYLYYVMPVVDGESLKDRLAREGRLSQAEVLRLVDQIAAALEHAHQRGLVHRDIKPANILLTGGQAIVADFGIALATSEIDESRLTETGLTVGTPAYMSPEQAAGHRDLDARSDQYSLACMVYEMLGGDPPFTGSTPRAVIARQITDLPPSLTTLRPDLSAGFEPALRQALSKVPGDRFDSVAGFADRIREAATGQVPTTLIPVASVRSRRRWGRAAASVGVAALLLGAGAWVWKLTMGSAGDVMRSIAVLTPDNLSGDTSTVYLVEGIHEGLITELGQLRDVRVKSRSAVLSFWDEQRSIQQVVNGLLVDGVVEVSILPATDSFRLTAKLVRGTTLDVVWARTYASPKGDLLRILALAARDVAREAGVPVSDRDALRLSATRAVNPEVYELVTRARQQNVWTEIGLDQAHRLVLAGLGKDPAYAPGWATLAFLLKQKMLFGYAAPADLAVQTVDAARRAVELDSLDAGNHTTLAEVEFYVNWDWAAAERSFARAKELNPSLVGNSYTHANFLTLTGRFDEALAEFERVSRNDPLNPDARLQLGWASLMAGRFPEALAAYRRTLELYPGAEKIVWHQAAWAYGWMDSTERAIDAVERFLADSAEPNDVLYLSTAATVYAAVGRLGDARRLLDSTFAWARAGDLPLDPYMVASVYVAMGDDASALRWLQRVLDERWPSMMFAAVTPSFPDRFRALPSVQQIFRKAGLPDWAGQPLRAGRSR